MDLFERQLEEKVRRTAPLADRMRPRSISEFVGQEHLLGEGKILQRVIDSGEVPSIILWGPPGCGKTSLARLLASTPGYYFHFFSAVLSGVKEVRQIVEEAKVQKELHDKRTILFVDEIHRFNRAQQDAFLPHVESGLIILIGATTQNPSFEINSPLLSRCRVLTLLPLTEGEMVLVLKQALSDEDRGLGKREVELEEGVLELLASGSAGDARVALNALELTAGHVRPKAGGPIRLTREAAQLVLESEGLYYDKGGEEHYNLISAFIKSMRGSDPDAALYWLARMLEGGEDPHFILRRMIIFAAEDVGNADPRALEIAVATRSAFDFVGLPEGWIPLAQAVAYLACAPKSNASYLAYKAALEDVKKHKHIPVPHSLRNASTDLMKKEGYGKGYKYPHDFPGGKTPQQYLPDALKGKKYYHPVDRGYEKRMKEWLDR